MESCNKALIINNSFDAGDDGICIKSGKDEQGRKRGEPCQNVIVMNNTVLHGHGGFVVGSEMSGGVNNIYVDNCTSWVQMLAYALKVIVGVADW